MTRKPRICHIAAHLGGGVGRALCHLLANDTEFEHHIITVENTRDKNNIKKINSINTTVIPADHIDDIRCFLKNYEIIQVEYWNHPRLLRLLSGLSGEAARWIFWCHISGLGSPKIPEMLPSTINACVFSSVLSEQNFRNRSNAAGNLSYIASAQGLSKPKLKSFKDRAIDGLYIGTLSPAKIHGNYISYLECFINAGFTNNLIAGTVTEDCLLEEQRKSKNLDGKFHMRGYVEDVQPVFEDAKYFLYILDPRHYGTGENALIEAMSAGVVPIVLNNPVESRIVSDANGGYIIEDPTGIRTLKDDLKDEGKWRRLSSQGVAYVFEHYAIGHISNEFKHLYQEILDGPRKPFDFFSIFGNSPCEWFLSGRADANRWSKISYIRQLIESGDYAVNSTTKGSLKHFAMTFPEEPVFKKWVMVKEKSSNVR